MTNGANGATSQPATTLAYAISSNSALIRAVILVGLTLGLTVGAGIVVVRSWKRYVDRPVKVTFNGSAAVFDFGDKNEFVPILVNASTMWTRTGVSVGPGETVQVQASGNIHLGLQRLTEAAVCDIQPPYLWNGPEGRPKVTLRPKDKLRRDLTLEKSDSIGQLLVYLQEEDRPEPHPLTNPRPRGGVKMNLAAEDSWTNKSSKAYRLYFGVNDLVLSDDSASRIGYLASADDPPDCLGNDGPTPRKTKRLARNWETIRKERQWDLYYHDNIGTFFVQVKLRKGGE